MEFGPALFASHACDFVGKAPALQKGQHLLLVMLLVEMAPAVGPLPGGGQCQGVVILVSQGLLDEFVGDAFLS